MNSSAQAWVFAEERHKEWSAAPQCFVQVSVAPLITLHAGRGGPSWRHRVPGQALSRVWVPVGPGWSPPVPPGGAALPRNIRS